VSRLRQGATPSQARPLEQTYDTLGAAEEALKTLGFKLVPGTCNWVDARGTDAGVYAVDRDTLGSKFRIEINDTAPDFNGAAEPMRALRDLINLVEATVFDAEEEAIITRAQAAFTVLRALHGDARPAEEIAFAAMREPDRATLQLTSGALRAVAAMLPDGERHVIHFTGRFAYLGSPPIAAILDVANAALEGMPEVACANLRRLTGADLSAEALAEAEAFASTEATVATAMQGDA